MAKTYELEIKLNTEVLEGIPIEEVHEYDEMSSDTWFEFEVLSWLNYKEFYQDQRDELFEFIEDSNDVLKLMRFNIPKMKETIDPNNDFADIIKMIDRLDMEVHYLWYIIDGMRDDCVDLDAILKLNIFDNLKKHMKDIREKFVSSILELEYDYSGVFSEYQENYIKENYNFKSKEDYIDTLIWLCPEKEYNTGGTFSGTSLSSGMASDFDGDQLEISKLNMDDHLKMKEIFVKNAMSSMEDGLNIDEELRYKLSDIKKKDGDTISDKYRPLNCTPTYIKDIVIRGGKKYIVIRHSNIPIPNELVQDINSLIGYNIRDIFPPHLTSEVMSYQSDFIQRIKPECVGNLPKLKELFKEEQTKFLNEFINGGGYSVVIESNKDITFVPDSYFTYDSRIDEFVDGSIVNCVMSYMRISKEPINEPGKIQTTVSNLCSRHNLKLEDINSKEYIMTEILPEMAVEPISKLRLALSPHGYTSTETHKIVLDIESLVSIFRNGFNDLLKLDTEEGRMLILAYYGRYKLIQLMLE